MVILQAWVFLVVPTDNNGDPHDYLLMAQNLFSATTHGSFNRFIGYPLFIKIASLNVRNINLIFFVQSLFFVVALHCFASALSVTPTLQSLVYLPALIPALAYMQKLLFPDGLLLSLLLLFMVQVLKGRLYPGLAIALIATAIKLVFIFLLPLALAAWALKHSDISPRRIYLCFFGLVLLLLPTVYLLRPFPLYQTVVQVPSFVPPAADALGPPAQLRVSCGGTVRTITDPAILSRVETHSADEYFMPLGREAAIQLGCTAEDLRTLQRQLILHYFLRAPLHQLMKFSTNALRAVFVFPQTYHVSYMLSQKAFLASKFDEQRSSYEDRQVHYFRDLGLVPPQQPGVLLLRLATHTSQLIRFLSIAIAAIAPLIAWRLFKTRSLLRRIGPMLAFLASYSLLLSWFGFVYDRYVYVNYFLWMYLAAVTVSDMIPNLARGSTSMGHI